MEGINNSPFACRNSHNIATDNLLISVPENRRTIGYDMETINHQEKSGICRINIILLAVTLAFSILYSWCFSLHQPAAQQLGIPVTYQGSIVSDEEEKRLSLPSFVYAEPVMNEIYIIDGKGRIIIYTSDFFPLYTMDKKNGIESPQGITVDDEGNVYVAQSASRGNPRPRISVLNACLQWHHDIYFKGFEGAESFAPYRLALDKEGNIFVAGSDYPGVLILNSSGQLIDILEAEEEGKKVKLTNVTLDEKGKIYLVSEEMSHIYVYDEHRKFLLKFGEKGGSSGKLSRPKAVGVDYRKGRMYVVDYMRHTISVYSMDGTFIFEFGGMGWGEGWFQHPLDLAVDSESRIMVADLFNQRVQVFNSW
jgi:DNA-binding beta-propeller fold protein YncE